MSEKEKKGFFSNLFGGNKKGCCDMEIVEDETPEKKDAPELVCT